ncbi:uncharacterized protein IL334_006132 [Kwoniella shivajii]|uniref:Amino acid permease/ SLC12A domain-containing protein n=1 Tax=Kwoniella shivajii TaxID=564305 RepID=A0ABZ1D5R3_9TREE|nr:hypothetical protein IL334_006132 [Kwoniella shivajii]
MWTCIASSNANHALSETRTPVRALRIAAPAAIAIVTVLYMLANIVYFAAVPRDQILGNVRILSASSFRSVMGKKAERALSVFVVLSASDNFQHWVVSMIIMHALPPGDAYNPILNIVSYPLAVVNCFVVGGLVGLYFHRKQYSWNPAVEAILPVAIFFFLSNVYLVIAPFIAPDSPDQNVYEI